MSNTRNPAALLASLLSSLSTGAIKVVELELDPRQPIEDQLDAIGEKIDAAHREECAACRAEYEAQQAAGEQPKADNPAGIVDELREKVKRHQELERAALAEKHNAERASLERQMADDMNFVGGTRKVTADQPFDAPYGEGEKPVFHQIGFVAFVDGKPITRSFSTDRDTIEKQLAMFRADPVARMINNFLGVDTASVPVDIRPVYDKR